MKEQIPPSLTFVVIVYNSGSMIEETLERLATDIERADWKNADILVVDDGSTDDTAAKATAYKKHTSVPITVHTQKNQGRLVASRVGTELAQGELVSFIGARVFMNEGSLAYLKDQLLSHPERRVWNCHIEVPRRHNIQAQFWHILTFVAWRRYLKKPHLMSFNIDDFDYYPKGTGGFICPKNLLLEGYSHLNSIYDDEKYSSDDTTLIRYIATKERIYMGPGYAADYIARSGFRNFVKHTYDRGAFLLDSYMRPGTRFFWPIIAYFLLFVPVLIVCILMPWLLLLIPVFIVLVVAGLLILGAALRDIVGFCILAPVFAFVYNLGMWKGLGIYLRTIIGRRFGKTTS